MDVIYLDIDSLRPDHIGAYGYDADTTPNIDALTADAVQFENAYTANSPCMPSRAALLSGRYGIANGVETHGVLGRTMNMPWTQHDMDGEDEDYWTLPELFFENRQTTAAVSSFPRHPAPWFYHLWHEFHQPQEPRGRGEYFQTPRAEDVTDRALDVLDRHDDEDVFLYTQYWDPHAPYNRSEAEVAAFENPPLPPHPTEDQIADHQDWDAWRGADQMGIDDRDDLAELLAGYDAEINYMDEHVGRLIDALKAEDRYDDALIILTADHAEEFGEHGLYREHWSTHDGTQKVPLLIKPPGGADGEARDQLVTNVDLAPSIADYTGLDAPDAWHGDSLRDVVEDDAEGRDHIVFDHGLYTAQRAVRTDQWKLIRTTHAGMWDGVVPDIQLYDMEQDPWEQDNVADDHPAVVDELEAVMEEFADEYAPIRGDTLQRVAEETPQGITHIAGEDEWDGV